MNILIVSFDKSLVKKLKEVLKEYNVMDAKNGEEALNTISSFIDVVIYDAVSGSMSEEDINNMYKHKFKDSRYIILVDDLFPVDMNNIIPPRKVKLMRDEAVEKIMDVLLQEAGEAYKTEVEQPLSPIGEEVATETPYEEGFILDKLPLEQVPEKSITPPSERKRLLLVSFDTEIINKVKEELSAKVEISEARNIKQAMDKVKEADIILFDTISGMLAYRTLMDMSKDEELRKKPYILLIDELFTIDVESIPLDKKYTFAREAELSKAIQKVLELIEGVPAEQIQEVSKEAPIVQDEEKDVMSLLEEIATSGASEVKEVEEEEITYSREEVRESVPPQEGEVLEPLHLESFADNLATAIKNIIIDQLSQEKLYSIISQVINYEALKIHLSDVIESEMEEALREQIREAFLKIDVAQIIREEAYKVLKERLREIIT